MNIKTDIDKMMKNIQVDDDMKMEILNSTVRTESKKSRRAMRKKVVAMALVAVMCVGTIAVSAENISMLWDKTVAKMLGVDEDTQRKTIEKGMVKVYNDDNGIGNEISVTHDGIKVSINQVLANKYSFCMYVNVEALDGKKIGNYGNVFESIEVFCDGEYISGGGEISPIDLSAIESFYHNGFWLKTSTKSMDLRDKELTVVCKNIIVEGKVFKGKWELPIVIEGYDDSIYVELNHTWDTEYEGSNGTEKSCQLAFKSIEIYPSTICIEYTGDQLKGMSNIPILIAMNDGAIYEHLSSQDKNTFMEYNVYDDGESEIRTFVNPIDIHEIDYVEVAGVRYNVE